ncbi:hypothetical protein ACO0LL_05615 [Undibacterium sp. TC4M20W]|uniref:hypothetical protein n=1 Tax=Undibacterium sp. TC4M20W TaxID=3413052 RepID=UPI003BEFFB2E
MRAKLRIPSIIPVFLKNQSSLPACILCYWPTEFKIHMYQDATDLFGEVVITEHDLFLWVSAVSPRWLTPERSYRNYLRMYNVEEKVRCSKLRGEFDRRVQDVYRPWHERLALDLIT